MSEKSTGNAHRDRGLLRARHVWGEQDLLPGRLPRRGGPGWDAMRWLGAELRRLRLELGISQRELTHRLGLSAHSNLGEYERGSRIPPRDIVLACERLFQVEPGYLEGLRALALRERARMLSWPADGEFPGGR